MKSFFGRRVAVPIWALAVGALVLFGIGASTAPDDETTVATEDTTTTTRRIVTTTTLSPEQQAAAAQAAAERAAAEQAAQEKAAADRAAAEKAAAEKAAADKAAADKAAADAAAAEAAARAPRVLTGTGSKVTPRFTLQEGNYRVQWTTRGPRDNIIVYIHSPDGGRENLVNEISPEPAAGEELFSSPGGEFFLQVDASELSWNVTFTKI